MKQIDTKNMAVTIGEMVVEARQKGYSAREIPWTDELLCAVLNNSADCAGQVDFYRAFPEKFRYTHDNVLQELKFISPRRRPPSSSFFSSVDSS